MTFITNKYFPLHKPHRNPSDTTIPKPFISLSLLKTQKPSQEPVRLTLTTPGPDRHSDPLRPARYPVRIYGQSTCVPSTSLAPITAHPQSVQSTGNDRQFWFARSRHRYLRKPHHIRKEYPVPLDKLAASSFTSPSRPGSPGRNTQSVDR